MELNYLSMQELTLNHVGKSSPIFNPYKSSVLFIVEKDTSQWENVLHI